MATEKRLNFYQPAPDLILQDVAGNPVHLAELWQDRPLMLAFTRHFGCTQCKEMLDELVVGRDKIAAAGLNLAVVTQGTPETSALFAKEYAPGLFLLADPERKA
jgi:peroxiredoxin